MSEDQVAQLQKEVEYQKEQRLKANDAHIHSRIDSVESKIDDGFKRMELRMAGLENKQIIDSNVITKIRTQLAIFFVAMSFVGAMGQTLFSWWLNN